MTDRKTWPEGVVYTVNDDAAATPPAPAAATPVAFDPGFVTTYPPGSAPGAQVWGAVNRAMFRVCLSGGTISKIGLHVAVQSGNISVAVYTASGTGLARVPLTRTATSGAVACPAVGYAEVALGASVAVQPGDFLALSCDNTTASFVGFSGQDTSAMSNGQSFRATPAHPLPTPAASLTATSFRVPALIGVP